MIYQKWSAILFALKVDSTTEERNSSSNQEQFFVSMNPSSYVLLGGEIVFILAEDTSIALEISHYVLQPEDLTVSSMYSSTNSTIILY
jgi:hypothetical protein